MKGIALLNLYLAVLKNGTGTAGIRPAMKKIAHLTRVSTLCCLKIVDLRTTRISRKPHNFNHLNLSDTEKHAGFLEPYNPISEDLKFS